MPNDTQVLPAAPLEATRKRWLAIVIGAFAAMAFGYGAYGLICTALMTRLNDQQASMLSANDTFLASALLFLALIGVVWLARPLRQSVGADATAGAH
jgi:hypothetical protein